MHTKTYSNKRPLIRGDIIEINTIVYGKYDSLAAPVLPRPDLYVTRWHDLTITKKSRAKYALHKFFFTNKVVNIWNSLPEYVVHKLFQKSSRQILVSSGTDI